METGQEGGERTAEVADCSGGPSSVVCLITSLSTSPSAVPAGLGAGSCVVGFGGMRQPQVVGDRGLPGAVPHRSQMGQHQEFHLQLASAPTIPPLGTGWGYMGTLGPRKARSPHAAACASADNIEIK